MAALGLSCNRQNLQYSFWHVGSSSLTRELTWARALRAQCLSHQTTREVPFFYLWNEDSRKCPLTPHSLIITSQKRKGLGFPRGSVVKNSQETLVQSLIQKEPTCPGATKLVHHNHWACGLEPRSRNCWARALQQEKALQWEALALQLRVAPQLPTTTEKPAQQWRPSTAKINNFSFSLMGRGLTLCVWGVM